MERILAAARARAPSLELAALGLALSLLTGCPLSTFEVDPRPSAGGSAGMGGAPIQNGGSPSLGGASGEEGGGSSVTRPRAMDDEYVILQGQDLVVTAAEGLLANDTPVGLRVAATLDEDAQRPKLFEAAVDVGEDGAFHFTPPSRFFGSYRFSYRAMNASRQTATASVEVRVVPVDVDLGAIVDGIGGYVLYGPAASGFGTAIDRAFDVNGDGLRDLVVGAPAEADGAGAAFVVFGKDDLLPIDLVSLSASSKERRFAAISAGANDALGVSVSGLGDWDGDGTPDLVLGGTGGNGRAYIVSGIDVTRGLSLPNGRGYLLEGDTANLDVGRVVHGAGDVNGDGMPDALVSASNLEYGWLHVLFGSLGLTGRATVTGAPGLHVRGALPGDGFPLAAVGVADVDGDGSAEVLASSNSSIVLLRGGIGYPPDVGQVTADGSHGGWSSRRAAPGIAAVSSLGDVNGDLVPDFGYCEGTAFCRVVFGPPSTLASGWLLTGFAPKSRRVQLAGGGDVDGDGLADVLLSDDHTAYLVYGKRAGFTDLNLARVGLDGCSLRAASGASITAIAILGDTNGDGLADLAIADSTADEGAGRVYVVFGVPVR